MKLANMKLVNGILTLCIMLPIWYYLIYKILVLVNGTELMWFLFWVYMPLGLFLKVMTHIIESKE